MFHINQENSGNFLQKEFMKTSKLHCYNTRQSSDLGFSLPSISTNFKRNFLTFDGVKIWNSLPLEIKSTRNKNPFKKNDEKIPSTELLRSYKLLNISTKKFL